MSNASEAPPEPASTPRRHRQKAHRANRRELRERAIKAHRLHLEGWTYREIAAECGYSDHTSAMRAIRNVMPDIDAEEIDTRRKTELHRLEMQYRNAVPLALGTPEVRDEATGLVTRDARPPDADWHRVLLSIHDRIRRLLRLDTDDEFDPEEALREAARENGLNPDDAVASAQSLLRKMKRR